jgi:Plasmid pRiA4b ORF-3-like protein
MPDSQPATAPATFTFRVRILGGFYAPRGARRIWRELELTADQTLADLGHAIPLAFGFDDPHLWSFFLSGKPWDRTSEYALPADDPFGDPKQAADVLAVSKVPADGEFLFLFDYGDEWHFGVKLTGTGQSTRPGTSYPHLVATHGDAPPQYPEIDDE